ncbi:MAG: flagellar basal body P-ring formation chaperone FlgA [Chthoniobacteraceae bacterium]
MIRLITIFIGLLTVAANAELGSLLEPVFVANGIAQASGMNLDRVVKRLQVEAGRHSLDGETLLREVAKELALRFGVNGELKLSFVRPWSSVQMPADDFSVTVTDAPPDGLASSFVVRVKVVSAAETVGEWSLAVRAQLIQDMWAANGRIERGQPLDRSVLAVQKVDVLRDRQAFLSADLDPATFDTAQPITSPRLLVRRDVTERPVVRKGQMVEVVAKQGLLAITMKALALEAGATGSMIKLRNVQSLKEFTGQIINESKVQVQF